MTIMCPKGSRASLFIITALFLNNSVDHLGLLMAVEGFSQSMGVFMAPRERLYKGSPAQISG